ncbi:hypothetical protein HOY80DRAFT_1136966 [Tuber brumale]|nr:hypothetical protein HOY80DRAFT_1136966 [Tuber brumale]
MNANMKWLVGSVVGIVLAGIGVNVLQIHHDRAREKSMGTYFEDVKVVLGWKFDRLDSRMERMESSMERMESKLDAVIARLDRSYWYR